MNKSAENTGKDGIDRRDRKPWRSYLIFLALAAAGTLTLYPMMLETVEVQLQTLDLEIPMSLETLAWLSLINPFLIAFAAVTAGHLTVRKTGLTSFTYDWDRRGTPFFSRFLPAVKTGIAGGAAAGLIIVVADIIFRPWVPDELVTGGEFPGLSHVLMAFVYGGIVEELMIRWGMMTVIVWLIWKLFQRKREVPGTAVFWVAIFVSSFFFALGHFGVTAASVEMTGTVFLRMMLLNGAAGIIFGWLYWKKGLETAMAAHIMAHVVMIGASIVAGLAG
ncbi:CPBP family intramembrane glutamic endopeptidase [Alteribacter natronophilus]|uniref:CPBP family intramembrane glutamic endopeptidase n=1 Tax=Alteribacter natronophilus TaxID=2583810 RepID=UPI0014872744|nr:CPBP family intramembrane glutamic endopeptidase [Alteribacter natronophilus]